MVAPTFTVMQLLPELESGGVERGTLEVGRHLVDHGHRSIVVSAGGRMVPQLIAEGSEHVAWPIGSKHPRCLAGIWLLRRFMMKNRLDILHLRSRLPGWIGYLAWKSLPRTVRPRLITTFHGFYSVNAYSGIMARGERVIAISEAVADHLRRCYRVPNERICLIHRGYDEAVFDPRVVGSQRIDAVKRYLRVNDTDSPLIVLPGRITRWKGQDVFIKSLRRIKNLSWSAVCVGDPEENSGYAKELRNLVQTSGLNDRILMAGHFQDMPAVLALADIAVSASSSQPEAFGRVSVEAQAMETPVVATAHGGSLETVRNGETGFLVSPGDDEDMARALERLVRHASLRKKMGQAGRKWVSRQFTRTKMCDSTLKLYGRILNEAS